MMKELKPDIKKVLDCQGYYELKKHVLKSINTSSIWHMHSLEICIHPTNLQDS
jgi:hypothetical protein